MKNKLLIIGSLIVLCPALSSCDWITTLTDAKYRQIKGMVRGQRVNITSYETLNNVSNTTLKFSFNKDKQNCVTRININLTTKGYSMLSYWIDHVTFKIHYDFLSDDGEYSTSYITISANPDKNCYSVSKINYNCNYRSVSNVSIHSADAQGYAVKI